MGRVLQRYCNGHNARFRLLPFLHLKFLQAPGDATGNRLQILVSGKGLHFGWSLTVAVMDGVADKILRISSNMAAFSWGQRVEEPARVQESQAGAGSLSWQSSVLQQLVYRNDGSYRGTSHAESSTVNARTQ